MSDYDSENEDSPFYFELEVDDEISFKAPCKQPKTISSTKPAIETSRNNFSMPKFSIKNLATSSELFKSSSDNSFDKENVSNAASQNVPDVVTMPILTPKKSYRMSMTSAVSFIDNMLRSPLMSRKPVSIPTIDEVTAIPSRTFYGELDEASDGDDCASLEAVVIERHSSVSADSINRRTNVVEKLEAVDEVSMEIPTKSIEEVVIESAETVSSNSNNLQTFADSRKEETHVNLLCAVQSDSLSNLDAKLDEKGTPDKMAASPIPDLEDDGEINRSIRIKILSTLMKKRNSMYPCTS